MMREADALEELWKSRAKSRRLANLRRRQFEQLDGVRASPMVEIPTIGGCRVIQMRQVDESDRVKNQESEGARI